MADQPGEPEHSPPRPLPELTLWNREYWLGGAADELRVQYCPTCSVYQHPPRPQCTRCGTSELAYPPVCGLGTVYTFSVLRHAYRPSLRLPIVMALVELPEQPGLRVAATLVDCRPEDVAIGQPVVVGFEPEDEGIFVPVFRPDRSV